MFWPAAMSSLSARFLFSTFVFILLLPKSLSWWGNGHMLVAEIARQELEPELVQRVQSLLAIYDGVFSSDFNVAATWEDTLKSGICLL